MLQFGHVLKSLVRDGFSLSGSGLKGQYTIVTLYVCLALLGLKVVLRIKFLYDVSCSECYELVWMDLLVASKTKLWSCGCISSAAKNLVRQGPVSAVVCHCCRLVADCSFHLFS